MEHPASAAADGFAVRELGLVPYEPVYQDMLQFTAERDAATTDEIWLLEHEPVFTLGQGGDVSGLLDTREIPVIQTDRGGKVTYHGPGQAIVYFLLDLKRRNRSHTHVRSLVTLLEDALIHTFESFGLYTGRISGAPGIYLDEQPGFARLKGAKIAALGLKIKSNGCVYHGLSINVDMNLSPFDRIHPCGYAGMQSVDMKTLGITVAVQDVQKRLLNVLLPLL